VDPAVGVVRAYLRLNGFLTATEYPVLSTARRRFGCCDGDSRNVAIQVVESGAAETHIGIIECRIRMMVFGGSGAAGTSDYSYLGLRHIAEYLNRFIERHRDIFTAVQPKDDVLDLMVLLAKLSLRF